MAASREAALATHVLLVDPHTLVRGAVAAQLETDPRIRITAACGDAAIARARLRAAPIDVAVVEAVLPG